MAYLVRMSARAERDFASLYEAVGADYSDAALEWYIRLNDAILTLGTLPYRCPATSENPMLRHLLYGRKPHVYRIVYRVMEKQKRVDVLHIRHSARRNFKVSNLG